MRGEVSPKLNVMLGIFGLKPSHDAFPAARSAAERALALDGSSAQALTVLADVRKFYEWDWNGAEAAYRRAIAIDPHSALAHHWYAQLLAMLARHDEAFAEIEAARQCDPVSPIINAFFSYILLEARQYDRAVPAWLSNSSRPPFVGRVVREGRRVSVGRRHALSAVRIAGSVPRFEGSPAMRTPGVDYGRSKMPMLPTSRARCGRRPLLRNWHLSPLPRANGSPGCEAGEWANMPSCIAKIP